MRVVRAGVELRMGLRGEEVRMIRQLEHLDDAAVRRHAAQAHTGVCQRGAVVVVDLVAVAVALVDERLAIELKGAGIRVQTAGVRAEAERTADVQNALLVGHQVDDGIGRVGHELDAVRLGQADDVACEFDNGKLHAEAQAEEGDAVLTGIADGFDHAVDAAAAEAAGDDDAGHIAQNFADVLRRDGLGVDPVDLHMGVVCHTGVAQRLCDAEVGVVQLRILADEGDVDAALRVHPAVAHLPPLRQVRLTLRQAQIAQHDLSQMLVLHHQGDLIENAGVEVLQHMVRADIAEQGELVADVLRQGVVGAAHEHVRPQADALQLADAALRRLRLHLAGGLEIRDEGDEQDDGILLADLILELADGLQEGLALHVADRAADLDDGDLVLAAVEAALDLVGDVRDDLHRAPAEVAAALALEHRAVHAAGRHVRNARQALVDEALIVAEIQVGLRAVVRDEHLAVLDRVHRAGVDVDIGVELLHRHGITARLEQPAERGGRDPLAEAGDNAAENKYIFYRHAKFPLCSGEGTPPCLVFQ